MHFVGNRAIVLGDGARDIQILYSMTFTGISFVLPVCVLLLAFSAFGVGEKAGYGRIALGGWLTGSAVCGMHYVGQLGIGNYRCIYEVGHVVGSAIIAIFASTTALGVFFRWRATWTDSWWRRGLSACALAGAVSGMHWTATTGTSYRDHNRSFGHGTQLSRSQTVIVCAVLVSRLFALLMYTSGLMNLNSLGMCIVFNPFDMCHHRWWKSQTVIHESSSASPVECVFRSGWPDHGHTGGVPSNSEDCRALHWPSMLPPERNRTVLGRSLLTLYSRHSTTMTSLERTPPSSGHSEQAGTGSW